MGALPGGICHEHGAVYCRASVCCSGCAATECTPAKCAIYRGSDSTGVFYHLQLSRPSEDHLRPGQDRSAKPTLNEATDHNRHVSETVRSSLSRLPEHSFGTYYKDRKLCRWAWLGPVWRNFRLVRMDATDWTVEPASRS